MKLDDQRVQFYLRHREQLEEWFEIRKEAAAAVDEWLRGLSADMKSLASELGDDVKFVAALDDDPSLYLKRSSWPGQTVNDSVFVGLHWAARNTLLYGSGPPYVFVQVDRNQPLARALRGDDKFQGVRQRSKDLNDPAWWPAYRSVLPTEPFPEKAEEYRGALLGAIRDVWNTYAPSIDAVLVTLMPSV